MEWHTQPHYNFFLQKKYFEKNLKKREKKTKYTKNTAWPNGAISGMAHTPSLQLLLLQKKTLPNGQWIQGFGCFDSINIFISKQKLQQYLKCWSNCSLVMFGKGRKIHLTTLSYLYNRSM